MRGDGCDTDSLSVAGLDIESPIGEGLRAAFADEVHVGCIIEKYKSDYGLDVSSYFGSRQAVKVYRCCRTGYRFYYPHNLAGREDLYAALQQRPGYYRFKWEHQIALRYVHAGENVLEVGCGGGLFLEQLKLRGIDGLGLELSSDAVAEAAKRGVTVRRALLAEHASEGTVHDAVCAFQVLEHVPCVGAFIKDALTVLKPGGAFIVGVPNSNPYLYRYEKDHTLNLPPHHMGLWDVSALRNITSIFGLRLKALHVEPLRAEEYAHYYALATKHAPTPAGRLFAAAMAAVPKLLFSRSLSAAARAAIGHLCQGRNLLAIYEKGGQPVRV